MSSYFKITFLYILFISCKGDDLPKPTTNGSIIFACKVDGEIFTPKSNDFKRSAKEVEFDNNSVLITGRRNIDAEFKLLNIYIKDFKGKKTYLLDNDSISYGEYRNDYDYYSTNINNTGKLIITNYDINKRILSGTFKFSAIDKKTNKIVKVSDGRFDLTF